MMFTVILLVLSINDHKSTNKTSEELLSILTSSDKTLIDKTDNPIIEITSVEGFDIDGWYFVNYAFKVSNTYDGASVLINDKSSVALWIFEDTSYEDTVGKNIPDDVIDWLANHKIIESKVSYNNKKSLLLNYPLLTELPYKDSIYTITYTVDTETNQPTIVVNTYEGYRQGIAIKISAWGYDPADYNIVFKEYVNPFKL